MTLAQFVVAVTIALTTIAVALIVGGGVDGGEREHEEGSGGNSTRVRRHKTRGRSVAGLRGDERKKRLTRACWRIFPRKTW